MADNWLLPVTRGVPDNEIYRCYDRTFRVGQRVAIVSYKWSQTRGAHVGRTGVLGFVRPGLAMYVQLDGADGVTRFDIEELI